MFHFPNIAFCGYMGSGKTTYAKRLVEQYGYTRMSFADPLKAQYEQLVGRELDKGRDRPHIQALGNLGRSAQSGIWVDRMLQRIHYHQGGPIVVDDVRYPDEAMALGKFAGFLLVHVELSEDDA